MEYPLASLIEQLALSSLVPSSLLGYVFSGSQNRFCASELVSKSRIG